MPAPAAGAAVAASSAARRRLLASASLPLRRRRLSSSAAMQPRFAPGTNTHSLEPALASLLGRWQLASDGRALERTFRFKTFAKTWDFMTAVALQAKIHNHHPEWSNVYNTTLVRWTTHNPLGLSEKDVRLAAICDTLAGDFQEVDVKESAGDTVEEELLARVVTNARDCCS
ncbi:hypothetical protein L249_4174 [Ophiocordyceps polyrhachis-furcata BCC 54312]|uniref:4a-hydroxytetrahydrobiopterin dehydratase n=1 Tax=Ophiocordyceps polyrhachis-furcata BCC 54312 TaxID=1330021 RepID=A0A367L5W7_9HYPO|nr:hypothetical protein L249_4174 [Ophiocordyceps polyrhachis-furcata BCC 54312]